MTEFGTQEYDGKVEKKRHTLRKCGSPVTQRFIP